MKFSILSKIGQRGMVLFLVLMILGTTHTKNRHVHNNSQASSHENLQDVQTLDSFLNDSKYKSMPSEEKLVSILAIFFCDFNVKGHFAKFVKTLIALLEDQANVVRLKSKFPTLNIGAIIAMLKKVENDKFSAQIVLKLRNYMNLFPEDLKKMFPQEIIDMSSMTLTSRISKRLSDAS